ncbi:DUF4960 domain-containing protein [Gaoshiqia sediminis]|uniref:DUF4960 domain-containing protein n=1 Tax=Gaoshiqia sediminis TaxID=2986998 RepID=A0AA41YB59_9BACT|nr:DUF4960 domain-containing protein [Gaoshiqia sediminis]MCW0484453.1 DUF4960 domain-containing protein [Gaoshiqia sediminis]
MKRLVYVNIVAVVVLILGLQSCNERENYMDGPKVLDIVESVTINSKSAEIDHLSGSINISLPGGTDLSSVAFEASAPEGATVTPASGSSLDLTTPFQVVVSNAVSERTYTIYATLLPSKVAFLGDGATIAEITDDDAKAAAQWTEATYGSDFVYISYADLSDEALDGVNVILYVYDNVGSSAQPAALLDNLNVLSKFYVQGGKIVAGLLGTGLVEELGRDNSGLRNIIGTGAGGSNPDTWGVGFTGSPVSNIISAGLDFYAPNMAYVIDAGYKEDHNALWNLGSITTSPYNTFNSRYDAEPIAAWDWAVGGQGFAGIIVWNPSGRFEGYIITIGIGGMEWSMNDDRDNPWLSNVQKIYKNSIDYLLAK